MGVLARFRAGLVIAATVGLLIPHHVLAAGPGAGEPIRDVALQTGGTLQGALLTAEGKPNVAHTVSLMSNNEVVATAVTGRDGRFEISGVRAGVYSIRTDESESVYRLWSVDSAPPSAQADLLLVTGQEQVVRGGGKYGSGNSNLMLTGGLILAAGVIGGVIGYNLKDDAS